MWKQIVWLLALLSGTVAAAQQREPSPDARLLQNVTVRTTHAPASSLLKLLSEQSGVPLRAIGEAADLRVTCSLTDQPLYAVMGRLAGVLGLAWLPDPDGQGYVLRMTDENRKAIEAAKAAEAAGFRNNVRRLLRYAADPTLPALTPLDSAARRIAAQGPVRTLAQVAAGLPDSVLDQALTAGRVQIPFRELSPAQQQALRGYVPVAAQFAAALDQDAARREFERTGEQRAPREAQNGPRLEDTLFQLSVSRRSGDGQRASLQMDVLGAGSRRGPGVGIGIHPTASLTLEEACAVQRHFTSRRTSGLGDRSPALPQFEKPLDWEDAVIRFARLNRVSFVSDAFDPWGEAIAHHLAAAPVPEDLKAEEVLDRLCMPYDYTWNAEQEILAFRRRDWALAREGEIPESTARRWREVAADRGVFPLSELSKMALMTEGQRDKLWKYAGMPAFRTVTLHRPHLLFIAALPAEALERARGAGLKPSELSLAQQQKLLPIMARARPGPLGPGQAAVRFSIAEQDKGANASLRLDFRDGERREVKLDTRATPPADPWPLRQMGASRP